MTSELLTEMIIGSFLSIITALIAHMAKSLNDLKRFAYEKIAQLETDIRNTNRILTQIVVDLKMVEAHSVNIAVMESQISDLKQDFSVLTKRVHMLETFERK